MMTNEHERAPAADTTNPGAKKLSDAQEAPRGGDVVSLTDYFDQMDRASFMRMLANRDAHRESAAKPIKLQRRQTEPSTSTKT